MTLASTDFKTEFAVDMTCQSCVDAVGKSIGSLPGIDRYDIDLEGKRVVITGKTPPSLLYHALKSTNRQVIVRGSSSVDPNTTTSAAVSILESSLPLPRSIATTTDPILAAQPGSTSAPTGTEEFTQKVFGICRFVQIAPSTVLMDLTVRLPPPANVGLGRTPWKVYVAQSGNMVDPPNTTGGALLPLGEIQPDAQGYGDLFKEIKGELWEWVGRGCIVESTERGEGREGAKRAVAGDGTIFAGVIARSAGAWGNDKTVCACSGRTMWEEKRDMDSEIKL